ncbi:MAG: hypothetical protein P8J87_12685 [Verrucomicrobiales bacterium]|nr:hypothetical protein [Verrucomicrobiales bacterium]
MTERLAKTLGVIAGIVCLAGGELYGDSVSVVWSSQSPGSAIATSDAVELSAGMLVRLGVFDLDKAAVEQAKSDPDFLNEHFLEITREIIGTFGASIVLGGGGTTVAEEGTAFGVAGGFSQKVSFNSATFAGGLEGKRFYIWAVDSSSLLDPEPGEQAIFSDSSWVLPPNAQATFLWDVSDVDADSSADVYVATEGSAGEVSENLGGGVNKMITLAAIDYLADADGDGVLRLLEEALGGDPNSPDIDVVLPEQVGVEFEGVVRRGLRYRRLAGGAGTTGIDYSSGGFRYRVQYSSDLENWVNLGSEALSVVAVEANGDGTETVTLAMIEDGEGAGGGGFLRLGVETLP